MDDGARSREALGNVFRTDCFYRIDAGEASWYGANMGRIRGVFARLGLFRPGSLEPASLIGERELRERVRMAGEIIVVLGECLPPLLHDWLQEREERPSSITILTAPDSQGEHLARLVEESFRVFEAVVPSREMVFLDRKVGYYLPGWEPIPDAFSLACSLLWRRLGSYLVLEGVVERTNPIFFALVGNRGVHIHYRGLDAPAVGEQVRVLAVYSFVGSWSAPFTVFAQWISRAEPRVESSAGDRHLTV